MQRITVKTPCCGYETLSSMCSPIGWNEFIKAVCCHACGSVFIQQDRSGAPPEEPVFILRAQDQSAGALIQLWITLNPQVNPEKMSSAMKTLEAMKAWPKKKLPD